MTLFQEVLLSMVAISAFVVWLYIKDLEIEERNKRDQDD